MEKRLDARTLVPILAVGVFGILNTEMGVVGILPQVSATYGVSVPDAGLLVSCFALVVAVAGPTMPLLFSRINRKRVMLLALGAFSVCNVVAALAPSFEVLLAARVIPAAFHPLYVSMAMAVAGQVGDDEAERTRNVSRVFVGVSAGMVLGGPIAGVIASAVSLRLAFAFFALVTIVVFLATLALVPSMPVERPMSYGAQLAILRKPELVVSFVAVLLTNGAMFGFYSYLTDFAGSAMGLPAGAASAVLLAYGLANIVGNTLAGRLLARMPDRAALVTPVALVALYLALFALAPVPAAAVAVAVVLGVAAGTMNTIQQYLIAHAAPEAPDFANGLFLTSTNLGTTLGTSLDGAFIAAAGTRSATLGSVVFMVCGIVGVAARNWVRRARRSGRGEPVAEA